MSTIIRFEEPAHRALAYEALDDLVAALKAHPGKWALLGKYNTQGSMRQAAYEIRHGLRYRFARGGFETESQSMLGEHRVYIRYTGGEVR